ncbi:MAG: MBL fold metallo-hydrolase [Oscillospiraceae bacterium]|nr:MBL fold metallo-hydrolase [Oscillospiraceae bacterium]
MIFETVFLGTNGSCAYNNGNRSKYGTNTSCVAVRINNDIILLDTGTGVMNLALPQAKLIDGNTRKEINVMYSHYHNDHTCGLLFLKSLFDSESKVCFFGERQLNPWQKIPRAVKAIIAGTISPPSCPITVSDLKAELEYVTAKTAKGKFRVGEHFSIMVKTHPLSHPGGAMGYRLEYAGRSLCYCTDVDLAEHQIDGEFDEELIKFVKNANLLICDSFFPEGTKQPGWGHSTPQECARLAEKANVKKLALFHYNPELTDAQIDSLEQEAQVIFPNTFASRDMMRFSL